MTCDGCVLKKCGERELNRGCDWAVTLDMLVDELSLYNLDMVKAAIVRLEHGE